MSIIALDAKIVNKRSTVASAVPAIGPSSDHTDGSWGVDDIYSGEFYINEADDKLFIGIDDSVFEIMLAGGGGGGIYGGSDIVPAAVVATLTDSIKFDSAVSFEIESHVAGVASTPLTVRRSDNSIISQVGTGGSGDGFYNIADAAGTTIIQLHSNSVSYINNDDGLVVGGVTPLAVGGLSVYAKSGNGSVLQGLDINPSQFILQLRDGNGATTNLFRNSGRVDLATNGTQTFMGDQAANYANQLVQEFEQFSNTALYTGFHANNDTNPTQSQLAVRASAANNSQWISGTGIMVIGTNWNGNFGSSANDPNIVITAAGKVGINPPTYLTGIGADLEVWGSVVRFRNQSGSMQLQVSAVSGPAIASIDAITAGQDSYLAFKSAGVSEITMGYDDSEDAFNIGELSIDNNTLFTLSKDANFAGWTRQFALSWGTDTVDDTLGGLSANVKWGVSGWKSDFQVHPHDLTRGVNARFFTPNGTSGGIYVGQASTGDTLGIQMLFDDDGATDLGRIKASGDILVSNFTAGGGNREIYIDPREQDKGFKVIGIASSGATHYQFVSLTTYANDAAADADADLPSGGAYLLTADRTLYIKP